MLVADLLFDLPLRHPLSYTVPDGLRVAPGQRVTAPVQGRARVGLVAALRDADASGLSAIASALESPYPDYEVLVVDQSDDPGTLLSSQSGIAARAPAALITPISTTAVRRRRVHRSTVLTI